MDEEKKSEASREDVEQVGPYQLHEQVPQDEHSRGELYRATHETSGVTALVLKPPEEDGAVPTRDWRVRCVSSDSPGYVALEDPTSQEGQPMIARPLPREPFKGQKRPPCTRYAEVELVGACWMPHEMKAPCPNVLFEHQGKCYAPVFRAQAPPQSIEQ